MSSSRTARDDEVAAWQQDGWVVLDGLISAEEIGAAAAELAVMFPSAEEYHADPTGTIERWRGRPPQQSQGYLWPAEGPGFRPEQHRWRREFPFAGGGLLNRLCVHPSIVDFAERALGSRDLRLYQAGLGAKYTGETNYEQPMHTDRNHSWLPPSGRAPWWHLETFLYLSDVDEASAPTHLVSLPDSVGRKPTMPLYMPDWDRELYAAEQAAVGVKGSLLAYRPDVFHRAVDLKAPGGSRFLLNVSFKVAGQDWVGFEGFQARAVDPQWDAFVADLSVRELDLFGFPPPGHPIWDDDLVAATAERYPGLDVSPWRDALPK
ncbi:MAG: hypothetical protein ACJ735_08285 [Actinomycetes bacterium]